MSALLNIFIHVGRNLELKRHCSLELRYPALTVEISSIINLRGPDCIPPEDNALLSTAQRLSVPMLGYGNEKRRSREAACEWARRPEEGTQRAAEIKAKATPVRPQSQWIGCVNYSCSGSCLNHRWNSKFTAAFFIFYLHVFLANKLSGKQSGDGPQKRETG